MAEHNPGTFEFFTRPHGNGYAPGVQATCSKCGVKQWLPARSPGLGHVIFKRKGWQLGRHGASKDVCPQCVETMVSYRRKTDLSNGTALDTNAVTAVEARRDMHAPVNTVLADKLSEALGQTQKPAEPWPAFLPYIGRDGATYNMATRGFSRRDNAVRSALRYFSLKGVEDARQGEHFITTSFPDGTWAWHPPDRTPAEKAEVRRGLHTGAPDPAPEPPPPTAPTQEEKPVDVKTERKRKTGAFTGSGYASRASAKGGAIGLLRRVGIDEPVENYHYMTHGEDGGTWGFTIRDLGRRVVLPAPATETPPPDAGPSREQRRQIMLALDAAYDTAGERYKGNRNDAAVASELGVPAVWVATMRAELYGDHDRNEAAEAATLDAAIIDAKASLDQLLDMAAKAENILMDLKNKRSKLED